MLFQFTYPTGGERLRAVFATFNNWGFQDFFIPFLLFFTIFFAILVKIQVFKTKKKVKVRDPATGNETEREVETSDRKMNGILAAVISLMVVIPHVLNYYERQYDPVRIVIDFIPNTTIVLVAILLALMMIGFSAKLPGQGEGLASFHYALGFVAVVVMLLVMISSIFPLFVPEWFRVDQNTQAVVLVLLAMALVVWYITGETKPSTAHNTLRGWFE